MMGTGSRSVLILNVLASSFPRDVSIPFPQVALINSPHKEKRGKNGLGSITSQNT